MRALHLALFGSLFSLAACDGCGPDRPIFCPGCYEPDSAVDDTDVDSDADTDGDTDSDTDGDTDSDTEFRDPGDYAIVDHMGAEEDVEIALTDLDGDSNKGQEFYAVLINNTDGSAGYEAWYTLDEETTIDTGSRSDPAPAPAEQQQAAVSPYHQNLRRWLAEKEQAGEEPAPPPPFPDLVVGENSDTFHVRKDINNAGLFDTPNATLAALGDTVAIWVDDDLGFDWDFNCEDDEIDIEDLDNDSFGFDNCDLAVIAGIVDSNIMVNLEALFGEFSDVNGDDRVTVLITPVLNRIPQSSSDPDDHAAVFESYADPEVDLNEHDSDENPVSDFQEVIYVFAPDPYGYINEDFTTTVEAYTGMSLAAQIAAETTHLIVYNQKVLELGGTDEEAWLMQGLGAVAADICGFGAIYFDDAWDYLDAPHLYGLTSATADEGALSLEGRGAQYLFVRWLVDVYGTEILAYLVQTDLTGTDAVTGAMLSMGVDADFEDVVVMWQVAMLTSGMINVDGDPLLDPDEWPSYGEAEFIEAPTEPPTSPSAGTYYGANGYQRGINFGGENLYMEGGTTAEPFETQSLRVTIGNSDHTTYVQGLKFFGSMEAGYAASVVRLAGVPYDQTMFNIDPSGDTLLGAVVRWNDPEFEDLAVEETFSSSVTNSIALPAIPEDGTPVYGIGEIGRPWQIVTYDPEGLYADGDFYDTDRWAIDLSDRAMGSQVRLHIWLDRHYENETGDAAPYDPWFAVVPTKWVPSPDETDTVRASCAHSDGIDFAYPTSVLEYLYYQEILAHTPISDGAVVQQEEDEQGGTGTGTGTTVFDACGEPPEDTGITLDCSNDWDLDGVADADEPVPSTFYEQVLVAMCSADSSLVDSDQWTMNWFDVDTLDEDEIATANKLLNTGGASDDSGEEAFLDITLQGGESYLLVIGGGTDEGAYEFTVREIPG